MRLLLSVLTICAVMILGSCTQQIQEDPSKSEVYLNFINELVERGQFNGNVLVAENGEVVFTASSGLNSIDGDSLRLNSQFRLASVSKQFTAMAIMTLKEEDKLDYDDPIKKHIPEWPYDATIRHLLHHTSGMPDYVDLFEEHWKTDLESDDPARSIEGNEHMVSMFVEHQPQVHFEPGEKYEYSNTAYVLLATIVARVSEMPFEDYMRENIFVPSGMNNTYVYSPLRDDPMQHRVYGIQKFLDGNELIENDYNFLNPVAGDGGIYSTLEDLFSWNKTLYTDKLVSMTSLEEAFTPAILNNGDTSMYGFGWGIRESEERGKSVSHSGGWVGFRTWIGRELDQKNCIIILTNNSSIYLGGAISGLTQILRGEEHNLPKLSGAELLAQVIFNDGIEAATSKLAEIKRDTANYNLLERQLNYLGYQLMGKDKNKEALALFTINTEEFPQSANVWDSQGDGYLKLGDTTSAINSFQKALEIDPELTTTSEKLEGIESL
jgi:CubicO group peptidase (beta-lactamase class C family)